VLESGHTIGRAAYLGAATHWHEPPARLQPKRNFSFSTRCFADFAAFGRDGTAMKTICVIFVLALIVVTFEIYSDAALTSAEFSHTSAPDPASAAIAHGLKHG
jgi:hypothetical protein